MAENHEPTVRGYELREEIGRGAFAVVYEASQPVVNRKVAIKVILPQYAGQPEFIRRFEAEAQLVARLEHPHIVPLYDYWREPSGAYLVMRYLRGGNLRSSLKEGPWSAERTAELLDQIARALSLAHQQGVVHRDIKPENILLDEEGDAYLTDFGIAKDLLQRGNQTEAGAVVGTFSYISPEQARSEPVSSKGDIYSLGVVIYELLTGEHPFPNDSATGQLIKHINQPLPSLQGHELGLPDGLDLVIQRATAKDPAQRYPDAMAFAAAIREAIYGSQASASLLHPDRIELINPYKGLRSFEEADAADFFGRQELVQRLLGRMTAEEQYSRFLALVGPSGSGKSSVVKAGLLPSIRQGNLPGSEAWFVVEMVPGTHPLDEIEIGLLQVAIKEPANLMEQLQRDERGLVRAAQLILPADGSELLLIVDQFEELFTRAVVDEERDQFLALLFEAVADSRSRVRVLITLRADFYDRPLMDPRFSQLMKARTEVVVPMTAEELSQAIAEPARAAGADTEPELVAQLVVDVSEEPGALPMLQYALTELFERRESQILILNEYRALGGVSGAIAQRAEEIYVGLDTPGQVASRQLFLRMVTMGEGVEDTRRRVLRSELEGIAAAGGKPELGSSHDLDSGQDPGSKRSLSPIPGVMDAYGRARLLTFDRDPITREPSIEVAHEALLREWSRFRGWLDESRADVRMQRMLSRSAAEWLEADREDGFLLRDARLDHFAGWVMTSTIALTSEEYAFLDASTDAREERQAEERERQQRELETARKLAETEKARAETQSARAEEQAQSANRLRRRALFLVGALIVAGILAVAAVFFARQSGQNATDAQKSADLAITREAEALAEAEQRATAEVQALSQAATAEAAQSEAQIQQGLAEEAAAEAQSQRTVAEEQAELATSRGLAAAAINNLDTDSELSVLLALQALSSANTVEARNALYATVPELRLLATLTDHIGPVVDFDLNQDGTRLASFDNQRIAKVWEIDSGQNLFSRISSAETGIETSSVSRAVALSPDGSLVAFVGKSLQTAGEGPIVVNIASDRILLNLRIGGQLVNDFSFNTDGTLLVAGLASGDIRIWDATSGEELSNFNGHSNSTTVGLPSRSGALKVAFSPDGTLLVTSGADGTAKVWEMSTGQELITITGHINEVNSVAFSPDGSRLATAGHDGTVRIWDFQPAIREITALLTIFVNQPVASAEFSPDGALLATGGSDGIARIWDAASGRELRKLIGHQGAISNVVFTPDGTRLITASDDTTIKIWDVAPDRELTTLLGDGSSMETVQFNPAGDRLATMTVNGALQIWDATTGENVLSQPSELAYHAARYSPDGSRLAKVSDSSEVQIINSDSGKELFTLSGITSRAQALAWSPDGSLLATTGLVGDVNIWDASSGESLQSITAHSSEIIRGLAFSPDGEQLVSAGWDNQASIWDVKNGELVSSLPTPPSPYNVVFSPDGKLLVVSGGDGTIDIWSISTNDPLKMVSIGGHAVPVPALAFSPDGAQLSTGSLDGSVKIWDVADSIALESGQEISTLSLHEGGVLDVDFSPDGKRLATASQDGTVKVTIVDFEELVSLAQERLTRGFTQEECRQYLHLESCPGEP